MALVQLCRSGGSGSGWASAARRSAKFVNTALAALDAEFAKLYAAEGRPSIAPERLLRAALIQILVLDPLGTPADGADAI